MVTGDEVVAVVGVEVTVGVDVVAEGVVDDGAEVLVVVVEVMGGEEVVVDVVELLHDARAGTIVMANNKNRIVIIFLFNIAS